MLRTCHRRARIALLLALPGLAIPLTLGREPAEAGLRRPIGFAMTSTGGGYWVATGSGYVVGRGDARPLGSLYGVETAQPVTAIAANPVSNGYWLATGEGSVSAFGDAEWYGDVDLQHRTVVAMAAVPTGRGYWLVTANGDVFSFGEAGDLRPAGSAALPAPMAPIAGIVATSSGNGYWLWTSRGRVYPFGDAGSYGSLAVKRARDRIVGMAPTPDGRGYFLADEAGRVHRLPVRMGRARAEVVVPVALVTRRSGYAVFGSDGRPLRPLRTSGPTSTTDPGRGTTSTTNSASTDTTDTTPPPTTNPPTSDPEPTTTTTADPAPGPSATDPELDGLFPIGVYVQPVGEFGKWRDRGINTLVRTPRGSDVGAWSAAARRMGLYMIRQPSPDPVDDRDESFLLAWSHVDEPDGVRRHVSVRQIRDQYDDWKRIDADRNVFINFVGSLDQRDRQTGEFGDVLYRGYVAGADWISADRYPVNQGARDIAVVGEMVDRLRELAGPKPVFAFIETGDFNLNDDNPGPTADQVRAEIWDAIIHGARGIWYFPVRVEPSTAFEFDTTPRDVAAEMTRQNRIITRLADVLQGPIDPGPLRARASAPLELTWRTTPAGHYLFVLNLGPRQTRQTITINELDATTAAVDGEHRTVPITDNTITDTFEPYELHIYRVAD